MAVFSVLFWNPANISYGKTTFLMALILQLRFALSLIHFHPLSGGDAYSTWLDYHPSSCVWSFFNNFKIFERDIKYGVDFNPCVLGGLFSLLDWVPESWNSLFFQFGDWSHGYFKDFPDDSKAAFPKSLTNCFSLVTSSQNRFLKNFVKNTNDHLTHIFPQF